MCPPSNLTPANLQVRDNVHIQLSKYGCVSTTTFYRSDDIQSNNDSSAFKTTDPVWLFHEPHQEFIKWYITGCVNGLFSFRLSNKKTVLTGIAPNILFKRSHSYHTKPIASMYAKSMINSSSSSNDPISHNDPIHSNYSLDSDNTVSSNDSKMDVDPDIQIPNQSPSNSAEDTSINPPDYVLLDEEFLDELGLEQDCDDQDDVEDENELQDVFEDAEDQQQRLRLHLWEVISSINDNIPVCTTLSMLVEITKKDAETLLHGRWLNDQIMIFFIEIANGFRNYEDAKYDACRNAFLGSCVEIYHCAQNFLDLLVPSFSYNGNYGFELSI